MRLRRADGFTLIELLVVLVIIGILLAISVTAYMGLRERAADRAAQQILRAALPTVHGYATDHGSFDGMTLAALRGYDQALRDLIVVSADHDSYCVAATASGHQWFASGPPFTVSQASCA